MERKIIVANWKMNGSMPLVESFGHAMGKLADTLPEAMELVVCPPAVYLRGMAQALGESRVRLGAQNCHAEAVGAHTGEISAPMLKEAGAEYVILGHSERREQQGETNAQVRAKAEAALKSSLIPIICVGESLAERESGTAIDVVVKQTKASIPTNHQPPTANHFIVAYEPIWAIGSGRIPEMGEIASMHRAVADALLSTTGKNIPVIYGGSVNEANARAILTCDGVHGALVGGASLKAESFVAIAAAAA